MEPLSDQTGSDVQHAMLISERRPVSLSGKDLFRRQHVSIHCTPAGLFLTVPDNKAFQAVQYLKSVIDFQFFWTFPGFNPAETFAMLNI